MKNEEKSSAPPGASGSEREKETHTPGPWKQHGAHSDIVSAYSGRAGSFVAATYGNNDAERDANARLIAAAPDLLREAKNLLAAIELVSGTGAELDDDELNDMRAAIAKAAALSDPDHRPSAEGEKVVEQSVSGTPHAK